MASCFLPKVYLEHTLARAERKPSRLETEPESFAEKPGFSYSGYGDVEGRSSRGADGVPAGAGTGLPDCVSGNGGTVQSPAGGAWAAPSALVFETCGVCTDAKPVFSV